jgi:hypothetical protein
LNFKTLLQDHQLYHSEFQQDHFITRRAGGTCYGQYKQSLRELFKRFRGLRELYYSKENLIIDIEELEEKNKSEHNSFQGRRNELLINKYKFDMIELDKNIYDTETEFKRFYEQAYSLKELIGDLDEVKKKQLDKEMWVFKLKEMAYLDFISKGRLSNNTLEFLHSFDKDERLSLLSEIKDHDNLLTWYEGRDEAYEIKEFDMDIPKIVMNNNTLLLEKEGNTI